MCVTNSRNRRPAVFNPQTVNVLQASLARKFCEQSVEPGSVQAAIAKPQTEESSFVTDLSTKINAVHHHKRRRKPQKPGFTAKQNERHFVVHNYHDHSHDQDVDALFGKGSNRRGGVSVSFPLKLHAMLDNVEEDGFADVVSWQPHGRAFVVHKPVEFVDHVLPKYFKQTKLTSFQRQLNLYGFVRLTKDPDNGGYYHELFLRGKPFLTRGMTRIKVKGTGFKAASSPDSEPDFYNMPPVGATVTPSGSDHDDDGVGHHPVARKPEPLRHPILAKPSFPSAAANPIFPLAAAKPTFPPAAARSSLTAGLAQPNYTPAPAGFTPPSTKSPFTPPSTKSPFTPTPVKFTPVPARAAFPPNPAKSTYPQNPDYLPTPEPLQSSRKPDPVPVASCDDLTPIDYKAFQDYDCASLSGDDNENKAYTTVKNDAFDELFEDELFLEFARAWSTGDEEDQFAMEDDAEFGMMLEMIMT